MNAIVKKISLLCERGAAAAGVLYVLAFIYVAAESVTYPFPLEWMEGHTVDIIRRILSGAALFVKPSLEFIPYLYTPFYFYISALVALFTGTDYLAGRLVSIAATFGSGLILYHWVRRENGTRAMALIAVGLFFATYPLSARWFDVGRVDSLYLFLLAAGLYVFIYHQTRRGALLAIALLVAAFFTKQSALMVFGPPLFAALWINRRHALFVGGVSIAVIAVTSVMWNVVSDGWFYFYLVEVPAGHAIDARKIWGFWHNDMAGECALMIMLALAAIVLAWRGDGWRKSLWFIMLAAGCIGSAYASRLHSFGWINVLMPVHFILALLSGLALSYAQRKPRLLLMAIVLAAGQMALLRYDPNGYIPTAESRAAAENLHEKLREIEGDILFVEMQNMPAAEGYRNYYYGMAGFDIIRSDLVEKEPIKEALLNEIKEGISNKRYAAVVTGRFLRIDSLGDYYQVADTLEKPKEYVTGAVGGVVRIFVPRE